MQHNTFVLIGQGSEESWFQLILPLIFVIVYILAGVARIFNEKKDNSLEEQDKAREEQLKGQWREAQQQKDTNDRWAGPDENGRESSHQIKKFSNSPQFDSRKPFSWPNEPESKSSGKLQTQMNMIERLRRQAEQQRLENEKKTASYKQQQNEQSKNYKSSGRISPEINKDIGQIGNLERDKVESFSLDISYIDEVRKGFIYSEILGPPKSIRENNWLW